MASRFSKQTVKNYLIERIELLNKENYFNLLTEQQLIGKDEIILKSYGEYVALTQALYDLLKVTH